MTAATPRGGAVLWFLLKFVVIASILLVIWWIIQPQYVFVLGHAAAIAIRYVAGIPIEGTEVSVNKTGVLNTMTALSYQYEGRPVKINVAFLVANIPAYVALVLATSGVGWRRRARATVIGSVVLFVGHVAFLTIMFAFAREVREAPELPTAFGMFVMTLPFILWIVLVYWERAAAWMQEVAKTKAE